GNDLFVGGAGDDNLVGGGGADVARFVMAGLPQGTMGSRLDDGGNTIVTFTPDGSDEGYDAFRITEGDGTWEVIDVRTEDQLAGRLSLGTDSMSGSFAAFEFIAGGPAGTVTISLTEAGPPNYEITGDTFGAVTEISGTDEHPPVTVTGSLSVFDPVFGSGTLSASTTPFGDGYGTFALDTETGQWTYTLDDGASDSLAGGDEPDRGYDYLTVMPEGGGSQLTVTVEITGANDPATITGETEFDVVYGTTPSISGSLSVFDPDHDESGFRAEDTQSGDYGHFEVSPTGNWTYTIDTDNEGQPPEGALDTLTLVTLDGSASETLTVHILPNQPPIAGNLFFTATSGEPTMFVLEASDPDSSELIFSFAYPPPSHGVGGTAPMITGNSFIYTGDPGYSGEDSFNYFVDDGVNDPVMGSGTIWVVSPLSGFDYGTAA
ncbi:MAG: VCBS domain-containing protein, partial [Alsobacter sp.]